MTTESTALERVRPQERALVQAADNLGILRESGGALMIDLSSPKLAERFNVLAPAATLVQADPNFTPSVSVVTLTKDDFYEIEKPKAASGNFAAKPGASALSKRALDVIGKQAGIEDVGPEIAYFGDRYENVRITWRCQVRRPDGTFQRLAGTREWVEEDEKALLEAQTPVWATKDEASRMKWWNENWYGRVKKFRLPMTETKARLRAYRQALTLKSKYSPDELDKPFLVVSTTFTPDTSDIRVLGMLMGQGVEATNLLYGPQTAPADDAIPGTCTEVDHTGEHMAEDFGADRETGEIPETHGAQPEQDPVLPDGPHKGEPLSQVARFDPDYVRGTLLGSKSPKWAIGAEEWLRYLYGEGGDDDGMQF